MTDALLALEDGTAFPGRAFGAPGTAFGEIVFNTGMSGYQEILTDPSYARQIVTMTAPEVGNYGVNRDDPESDRVQAAAFVVREVSTRASSWRSEGDLDAYLAEAGVPGISEVDTRALTLRIREAGAMRAGVSTEVLEAGELTALVRKQPGMEGADLAAGVSTGEPYEAAGLVGPALAGDGRVFRVAAYDWGLKWSILRRLAAAGCEAVVLPAATPADAVLTGRYDGVFLSNGPGDPAATGYAVGIARDLLGRIPVFGICLGHQILGLAAGGGSYKLKFGHRGANQPVIDLDTGRVEVTSHNHGFGVDPRPWGGPSEAPREGPAPEVETEVGRAALTHWNLNDGALEGMRFLDVPAFCVQYHPEAAPGPNDAIHLFSRFRDLMEGSRAPA